MYFQRVAGLNGLNGVQYVLVSENGQITPLNGQITPINGQITPLNKQDNLHLVQRSEAGINLLQRSEAVNRISKEQQQQQVWSQIFTIIYIFLISLCLFYALVSVDSAKSADA